MGCNTFYDNLKNQIGISAVAAFNNSHLFLLLLLLYCVINTKIAQLNAIRETILSYTQCSPIPFIAILRILLFNRVNRTRVQTINRARRPRPLPSFFTIPRTPSAAAAIHGTYVYTRVSPLRFTISVWYYNFGL